MTEKLPEYDPRTFQQNKLPKDLFDKLRYIVYEKGYLCYHDDQGCHFVLNSIVELLHSYKISSE